MRPYLSDVFGNADSRHSYGREAAAALASARAEIAACIGARPEEIYFTSGGTESDNWAVKGTAFFRGKGHIVTSEVEHPAVYESCRQLARMGYDVTFIPVDGEGMVSVRSLEKAMREDTFLVSVMSANNETGVLQPVEELCAVAHAHGALFHTDAVQAAGAVRVDIAESGVDMLSLSAHKFGGPKGFGVLYIKNGVRTESLLSGGEQERGRRGGTSCVAGAAGTAAALKSAVARIESEGERVRALKDAFAARVIDGIEGAHVNGSTNAEKTLPGIVNFRFDGVTGEELLFSLDLAGVAASNGSACSAGSSEPSRTLLALGLTPAEAKGAVRFSFGRINGADDAEFAFRCLKSAVERLRDRR